MDDETSDRGPGGRTGEVAVTFVSRLRGHDPDGYRAAAEAMDTLAARQPGFRGIASARGDDGLGITVSWWADDAAAIAWRDHPEHRAIRTRGRADWYDRYEVTVARIERAYRWSAS